MRDINLIVVHCSATRVNQNFTVEQLEACHKARGFDTIGYHYYITKERHPLSLPAGAHRRGSCPPLQRPLHRYLL